MCVLYHKCLLELQSDFVASGLQVWLDFAHWHAAGGGKGPAVACQTLQRAIKACPRHSGA